MYSHLVPQSYLKSWLSGAGSKNVNFLCKGQTDFEKDGRNIEKIFGKTNYYRIELFPNVDNIKDFNNGDYKFLVENIHKIFKNFFDKIDQTVLKDFYIEVGKNIIRTDKCLKYLYNFYNEIDNSIILDLSLKPIGKRNSNKIRNDIQSAWKQDSQDVVESYFSTNLENDLGSFFSNLFRMLDNHKVNEVLNDHDEITKYLIFQECRNPKSTIVHKGFEKAGVDAVNYIKTLPEFKDKGLGLENFSDFELQQLTVMQFLRYIENVQSELGAGYSSSIIEVYIKKYHNYSLHFLPASKDHKFITGDLPTGEIEISKTQHIHFMPLSPNWCLFVTQNSAKKPEVYIASKPNDKIADYVNFIIYKQCQQGIVSLDKRFKTKVRAFPNNDFYSFFMNNHLRIDGLKRK